MWYTLDKDSSLVSRSLGAIRWAGLSCPIYVLCDAHTVGGEVFMSGGARPSCIVLTPQVSIRSPRHCSVSTPSSSQTTEPGV